MSLSAQRKPHISLSGLIGAGKSTLAKRLAERLAVPLHEEKVADNELLSDFYRDMGKYGFELQVSLLTNRYKQQQGIVWSVEGGVQDRTLEEDTAFARLLTKHNFMTQSQLGTYMQLLATMKRGLTAPDFVVHLKVKPEECLRRIRMRNRPMEKGITLEYLQSLEREYEDILVEMSPTPVIIVPWDKFEDDIEKVVTTIEREVKSFSNIRTVSQ